jgi:hypothetical protein
MNLPTKNLKPMPAKTKLFKVEKCRKRPIFSFIRDEEKLAKMAKCHSGEEFRNFSKKQEL